MPEVSAADVIEYLSEYLTDRRKFLIEKVLDQRTRHITIVLEDIYKPQNASAVLRTAECQGVQDLHIIENEHLYDVNPDVVKGASKWLTLHKYPKNGGNNTALCFKDLREKGYRIICTDPRGTRSIEQLEIQQRIALVFGTEYTGLSDQARDGADELVSIPMHGFTESYNLSVSAAICLQSLTSRMRNAEIDWGLTADEKQQLKLLWYKGQVRDADAMINRHFDKVVG